MTRMKKHIRAPQPKSIQLTSTDLAAVVGGFEFEPERVKWSKGGEVITQPTTTK